MAQPLPIVAQYAMDEYYRSYKDASQFFELSDFIYHCGATLGDIFQQVYELRYAELRAMKQDDVVGFPADWLSEQRLKVQRKENETFVVLEKSIMSFNHANETIGIQDVLPVKPQDANLERSTQATVWQNSHIPFTNRIFWYVSGDKIVFVKKGGCNIAEVKVLYIPAIGEDVLVPDTLVKKVKDNTVATMRQLEQGVVVKKGIDQNQNLVLQAEMNKKAL